MGKFCVLDTEATNTGKANLARFGVGASVYDLGYIIADQDGAIMYERSIILAETFNNAALMESAYYAAKIPAYYDGLAHGKHQLMTTKAAIDLLRSDLKEWNVRDVWAYNAYFDRDALYSTIEQASNGWQKFALPYGVKWRDILDYTRRTIAHTKKYAAFAGSHGLLTKAGKPRVTADAVGKYLRGKDYSEQHTALSDARDELFILQRCLKSKKKKPRRFL